MHQHLFLKLAHKAASFPHCFPLSTPYYLSFSVSLSLFLSFHPFFTRDCLVKIWRWMVTAAGLMSVSRAIPLFVCDSLFTHTSANNNYLTIDLSVDCFLVFFYHRLIRYSASWPLLSSSSYATCCVQNCLQYKGYNIKWVWNFRVWSSRRVKIDTNTDPRKLLKR